MQARGAPVERGGGGERVFASLQQQRYAARRRVRRLPWPRAERQAQGRDGLGG